MKANLFLVWLSIACTFTGAANAASAIWLSSPTSSDWVTSVGVNNWSTGNNTFPGSISVVTNLDTATFNTASTQTAITINSASLNIKSLTFDTVNAAAYTIGSTGGNSLLLTSGGAISMNAAVANTETVNAPLVLEGAGATYTIQNNASDNTKLLNIGGAVSGGTSGANVLTLRGSNTGNNTISGAISNGSATTLAVTKSEAGTWVLTGANTYTGNTTVNAGTLSLAHSGGTIADTAGVIVSGGTLDVAQDDTVGAVTISGGATISGTGTLNALSYNANSGGTANILCNLTGTGNLTSSYTNEVIALSGNNSGWSGSIGATGSPLALLVGSKNALGTGAVYLGGNLSASVDLSGTNAITNNFTINGGGAAASGSNNITLNGSFTVATSSAPAFANNMTGGTLVLAGPVYISDLVGTGRTLTITGTGNTTISGAIANFNGAGANGAFAMSNTGTTVLTGMVLPQNL